jgi:GMP synthase (glutamine-hydrolysing)
MRDGGVGRGEFQEEKTASGGAWMKTAVAIRHVAFEDLGLLGPVLERRGFALQIVEAAGGLAGVDALAPDLLVVLGGPIGAYEDLAYPFLKRELALVAERLAADRPTLGICLGAQIIARALGAAVYPGGVKEIGWAPVRLTEDGRRSCLAPLGDDALHVLHWHGDTFDLPEGATRLASTDLYANQAFAWGRAALALQFHLEATAEGLEHWYAGHAGEIAGCDGVTVPALRAEGRRYGARLRPVAEGIFADWLDGVGV